MSAPLLNGLQRCLGKHREEASKEDDARRVRQLRRSWSSTLTLLQRWRRESSQETCRGEAFLKDRYSVVAPEGFVLEKK